MPVKEIPKAKKARVARTAYTAVYTPPPPRYKGRLYVSGEPGREDSKGKADFEVETLTTDSSHVGLVVTFGVEEEGAEKTTITLHLDAHGAREMGHLLLLYANDLSEDDGDGD
jgi:hypothetical protein